jgi:hypothetical protein
LFGLFLSKLNAPTNDPGEDDSGSVHPQNNSTPETPLRQFQRPTTPQIPPTTTEHYYPDRRKDNTPPWKKRTEIAAVIIAGVLIAANVFVTIGTWRAANASKSTAETAAKQMEVSERP